MPRCQASLGAEGVQRWGKLWLPRAISCQDSELWWASGLFLNMELPRKSLLQAEELVIPRILWRKPRQLTATNPLLPLCVDKPGLYGYLLLFCCAQFSHFFPQGCASVVWHFLTNMLHQGEASTGNTFIAAVIALQTVVVCLAPAGWGCDIIRDS